ncbi:family 16 glycoside hydrolase [Actinoplanes sp. CA-051413]|uniref:family 16 glycoside hydrolase n=1 Tax=Actinoplanes sp. CA-051413 TaxID=3239899 RepID=UPI003D9A08DC
MGASAGPAVPPSTRRLLGAGLVALLLVAAPALLRPEPAGAVAAAPVLLSDDFEDGDANGWRTTGGRWAVATDETGVLQQSATSTRALARAGEPAWADYSVSTRVKQLTGDAGSSTAVLARIQSDGSHYYLASRADDTVELGRVSGGRSTPLASASYPSYPQVWRSLTLVVKGDRLVGVVNGAPLLTATDTRLRRGRAGLATTSATASFDDVRVQSYAASTPDTQAPLIPGRPSVTVTPATATLTWPPTVDNVGVTEYVVYQGEQFYQQYPVRTVTGTGPVTLTLNPAAASIHFSVAARDAAGNLSQPSSRVTIPQPPSFPKTGDDTVPPTAPGNPVRTGPDVLSWTPATDNVGVREYHVLLVVNIDEVRLLAKVTEPSAVVTVTGSNPLVRVIAYDGAWNSSSSALVPYGPAATPTPTAGG